MKQIFLVGAVLLGLNSCGTTDSNSGTNPTPQPQPTAVTYTLQSVTVSGQTVTCPSKSDALAVDCSNNKATFDGKNYDLGATVSNPARTGTYTLSGNTMTLSSGFSGTWTVAGKDATLLINTMGNGSFSGSIRLPITFKYTQN